MIEQGRYFDAVETDLNAPRNRLLGRDHAREIKVGDLVFAYTDDDTQPFGVLARVIEVKPSEYSNTNLLVMDATEPGSPEG